MIVVDETAEHEALAFLRATARTMAAFGVDADPSIFAEPLPKEETDGR